MAVSAGGKYLSQKNRIYPPCSFIQQSVQFDLFQEGTLFDFPCMLD